MEATEVTKGRRHMDKDLLRAILDLQDMVKGPLQESLDLQDMDLRAILDRQDMVKDPLQENLDLQAIDNRARKSEARRDLELVTKPASLPMVGNTR